MFCCVYLCLLLNALLKVTATGKTGKMRFAVRTWSCGGSLAPQPALRCCIYHLYCRSINQKAQRAVASKHNVLSSNSSFLPPLSGGVMAGSDLGP